MIVIAEGQETVAAVPTVQRRGGSVVVVDFDRQGNSASYRTFGWSGQETTHVWSTGESCGLSLPPMAEQTPLIVDIDLANTIVEPHLTKAVVRVFANGHPIGCAVLTGRTRLRCMIPSEFFLAGEPIALRFEHPCYVRLDRANLGTENRVLGLCFYSICMFPPWLRQGAEALMPRPPDRTTTEAAPPALAGDGGAPSVYRFGAAATDRGLLLGGWRFDEAGDAWADARHSHVEVPAPEHPGNYRVDFKIVPLYIRSLLQAQRIVVLLGGAVIGQFRTGTEGVLSVPLPPELVVAGSMLKFTFATPDGMPMHQFAAADGRYFLSFILDGIEIAPNPPRLGAFARLRADDLLPPTPIAVSDRFLEESVEEFPLAVKSALGLEIAEIMGLLESLGDNCGFGIAQRKAGCEVLGLLRFANTPLRNLMVALDDEFRAVLDKTKIEMRWVPGDPGEFVLHVKQYGLRWHTRVSNADADHTTLLAQQTMRLSYLRRKFYEAAKSERKIFVIARAEPRKHPIPMPDANERTDWEERPEPLRVADLMPLVAKLNEYGTNTLLYLTQCERGRQSGTVELIAPGLLRGYMDDFVILENVAIRDHVTWMRVAVNAWLLHQDQNASRRQTSRE